MSQRMTPLIVEKVKLLWLTKRMLSNGYISNVPYLNQLPVTIFTKLIGQGLLGKHWMAQTLDVVISWFINSLFIRRGEESPLLQSFLMNPLQLSK